MSIKIEAGYYIFRAVALSRTGEMETIYSQRNNISDYEGLVRCREMFRDSIEVRGYQIAKPIEHHWSEDQSSDFWLDL